MFIHWICHKTLWLLSPQLSGTKKEKDGEDKKRNPILKYIGKPRNTSQSSKYTHLQLENHSFECNQGPHLKCETFLRKVNLTESVHCNTNMHIVFVK